MQRMRLILLLVIAATLAYGAAHVSTIRLGERATGGYDGKSTATPEDVLRAEQLAREAAEAATKASIRAAEQ
ncbi:Uncharacterised protein [Delftia tsuruhatensis]|nr:Uncharacterised protein [Delftia tsuruhatensis]CAC9685346.1 Uncharacterised protein [Delftia tsuruhatensis]